LRPSDGDDVPREDSLAIRDAFAWVRGYLRSLQQCSTLGEVLTLVEEMAGTAFPETSYMTTTVRQPCGAWSFHSPGSGTRSGLRTFRRNQAILGPIMEANSSLHDAMTRFPRASAPGDILTFENYDSVVLGRMLNQARVEIECVHESVLTAVIRSRSGFVAHLFLSDFRRVYCSETERALVATLADFASLAVSS
jgi:hypothetical protein